MKKLIIGTITELAGMDFPALGALECSGTATIMITLPMELYAGQIFKFGDDKNQYEVEVIADPIDKPMRTIMEVVQEAADILGLDIKPTKIKKAPSFGDVVKLKNGNFSIVGLFPELTKEELKDVWPVASDEWLEGLAVETNS